MNSFKQCPLFLPRFVRHLGVCGIYLFSILSSSASLPGDEHWDNQFGFVGTSDPLWSITALGGDIYVGGTFTAAGNTEAGAVAGYDGTNWFQLNNGVSGGLNITYVFTLANDGTNVYAGGWFTNADDSGAINIARWDGGSWYPLAGGTLNSIVETIKIAGTNIFVGGVFTTNGNVTVNGIARWDGANWHALGAGVAGAPLIPAVLAIEYDGTNVYIGGTFTQAGSVSATNVAYWNGTSWSAMGNEFSGSVTALCRFGGYLYAGGTFTNTSLGIYNLAKWNGSTWSAVGAGTDHEVRALITDGTNLYVGGDFTQMNGMAANRIARWDGNNWYTLGAGVEGFGVGVSPGVYSMAFDSHHRLIVAGNFDQVGSVGASHVGGWDGTNWFALGGAASKGLTHFLGVVSAFASDGANLYTCGTFSEGGSQIMYQVGSWDGTNWSPVGASTPGGLPMTGPRALALANGQLFTGGAFTNIGSYAITRVGYWDGANWNDIGGVDSAVNALAYDGNYVWIGGAFTNVDGGFSSPGLAAYLPGSGWYSYGAVAGGSHTVNAITWDGNNLYVGGNFTSFSGYNVFTNIFEISGGYLYTLGNGLNGTVNAIAVTNGVVYVGGSFTTAGTTPANRIAEWNGTTWSALGSGVSGTSSSAAVTAIALNGNTVYAGGTFTNAGGAFAQGVAAWNGSTWSGLGSGLFFSVANGPGSPRALAMMGNDLYVGGQFSQAGAKPASFISRWNDQLDFYPTPHPELTRETMLTNRQFQFRLTGTSGESYILQASTNLVQWTSLLTNSTTLFDYTDTNAAKIAGRFYRAVLGP